MTTTELIKLLKRIEFGASGRAREVSFTDKCFKCKSQLIASEIEIFGEYHEVGGFCDNEKCERYLILVV